eukprot:674145-Prorocentrum_minimum.AAC.1
MHVSAPAIRVTTLLPPASPHRTPADPHQPPSPPPPVLLEIRLCGTSSVRCRPSDQRSPVRSTLPHEPSTHHAGTEQTPRERDDPE